MLPTVGMTTVPSIVSQEHLRSPLLAKHGGKEGDPGPQIAGCHAIPATCPNAADNSAQYADAESCQALLSRLDQRDSAHITQYGENHAVGVLTKYQSVRHSQDRAGIEDDEIVLLPELFEESAGLLLAQGLKSPGYPNCPQGAATGQESQWP